MDTLTAQQHVDKYCAFNGHAACGKKWEVQPTEDGS